MGCESQRQAIQVSDWSVRPLSERQLHYAALDAALLLHMFDAMATSSSLKCADLSGLDQDWRAGSQQPQKEPRDSIRITPASSDANSYAYPQDGAMVKVASGPFMPDASSHQTPAKGDAHYVHLSPTSGSRGTGGSAPSRSSSCNACRGSLAGVGWPRLRSGERHVSSRTDSIEHHGPHGQRRHLQASSFRCTARAATCAESRRLHVNCARNSCSVTAMLPVPAMQTVRMRALIKAARRTCRFPLCQFLLAVV
jgi:hypothetical protein